MPTNTDVTQRFSSRVDNYVRYRPAYPQAAIDCLRSDYGLGPDSVVADIGSGTGILTRQLLQTGCAVLAVEPNHEMQSAARAMLGAQPKFTGVDARAEATGLPDHSVSLITVAQAFHWFDRSAVQQEFRRILRPGGFCALIWNDRLTAGTPFLEAYEQLLRDYATDYLQVNHKTISDENLGPFFAPGSYRLHSFPNAQYFDHAGLEGRLLSSSYAPEAGRPGYAPMLRQLRTIFDLYAVDGRVAFTYQTQLHAGRML